HIVEIDYPESARDWAATDLDALVDLEPIRQESPPALHDALRGLADSIDEVVLATDYDREGELIGVEALETIRHKHPDLPARRAPIRGVRGRRTLLGRERRAGPRGVGGTGRYCKGPADRAEGATRAATGPVQHDVVPGPRFEAGAQCVPSDGRRSGIVRPRRNQLSSDRQHGIPAIPTRPGDSRPIAEVPVSGLRRAPPRASGT